MQSYFSRRGMSIPEMICVVGWILCVPVTIFMQGGIPIGMTVAAVLAVIYIIYNGAKIKDSDVDAVLQSMVDECNLPPDDRMLLQCYDLSSAPVVKGKDGKLRTPLYVVAAFSENEEGLRATVYRMSLIDGKTERSLYTLPPNTSLQLTEAPIMTPNGRRVRTALSSPLWESDIPVSTADIDSARLIEHLCNRHS